MKLPRSHFLAPAPKPDAGAGRWAIATRWAVAIAAAVGIRLLIGAVVGRTLPAGETLGNLLYSLHDRVFLWVKGYLFTRYYPWSLVAWGLLALVLGLAVASLLGNRSFLRRPHTSLLRTVLRRSGFAAGRLIAITVRLRPAGLGGELLREVAADERRLALRELFTSPSSVNLAGACDRLVWVTRLAIAARLLPPAARLDHLTAAVYWHDALLLARRECRPAAGLAAEVERIVAPLLDSEALADGGPCFTAGAVARDLRLLAALDLGRVPDQLGAGPGAPPLTAGQRAALRAALAESVERRRDLLSQARAALERRAFPGAPGPADAVRVEAAFPAAWSAELPLVGELALGIALAVAGLGPAPEVALGYLEAVEALALALDLAPPGPGEFDGVLAGLVAGLPRPEHYRIAAELSSGAVQGQKAAWAFLGDAPDRAVRPRDFDLADGRVAALDLAAGPDFDRLALRPRQEKA